MEKALVIINPNAGKRRGHRDWPLISYLLIDAGVHFDHVFTEGTMDAARFAVKAAKQGIRHIITVGGDGTLNEVAHGLLQECRELAAGIRLSLIPVGTGNDWTRTWGIPLDYKESVKVASGGKSVMQDAGCVSYESPEGRMERYFLNVAGVGLDAEVVFDTNERKARGSAGKIAYLVSLIKAMFRYRARMARFVIDDRTVFEGKLYSANVGICRYSGGGMQQVPGALPDDGLFDVTIIGDVSLRKVIGNVKGLYDGSFTRLKEVSTYRTTNISIVSNEGLLLEVDGESLGRPPFDFSILPGAVCVTVPLSYVSGAVVANR